VITYPSLSTYPGVATFPESPAFYRFVPPTETVAYKLEGRLYAEMDLGLNVRQTAGGPWVTEVYTQHGDLEAAVAFYAGGRDYTITESQRDALVAGGFGDYITIIPEE
jgi:hypothetical protein